MNNFNIQDRAKHSHIWNTYETLPQAQNTKKRDMEEEQVQHSKKYRQDIRSLIPPVIAVEQQWDNTSDILSKGLVTLGLTLIDKQNTEEKIKFYSRILFQQMQQVSNQIQSRQNSLIFMNVGSALNKILQA